MKKYHFWCDAHGKEIIEFHDDADEHDIQEAFSEWIENILVDATDEYIQELDTNEQLLKDERNYGYHED